MKLYKFEVMLRATSISKLGIDLTVGKAHKTPPSGTLK